MSRLLTSQRDFLTVAMKKPPQGYSRMYKESRRLCYEAVIEYWYEEMLEEHFTFAAIARYGYQKRTRRYEMTKGRVKHHRLPMVWSGAMKKAMLARRPPIRHSQKEAWIAFTQLPKHSYITSSLETITKGKRKKGKKVSGDTYTKFVQRPDKTVEVTRVAASEVERLAAVYELKFATIFSRAQRWQDAGRKGR